MRSVLTLVCPPGGDLDAAAVAAARALAAAGARVGDAGVLAPATACDLPFDDLAPSAADRAVRRALAGRPIDLAAQPRAGRRKRLLIADLESTLIDNEMLDELAALIGAGERVAAITRRAMNGELDFRRALAERVALLAGQPAALLERARRRIVVAPGAEVLVATLRAHGTDVVMVSGGFLAFARPLAARLGCAAVEANELEIAGGRLTGRVVEPILDRAAKRRALERHCAARGLEPSQAAAVGDGANDLELLRAAGLGVAYRAKPAVAAAARQRIDHGDLTALLYFQGYRREELAC